MIIHLEDSLDIMSTLADPNGVHFQNGPEAYDLVMSYAITNIDTSDVQEMTAEWILIEIATDVGKLWGTNTYSATAISYWRISTHLML